MSVMAIERLDWLCRQIDCGWQLEAPVIERVVYHGAAGRASAFEFILRSGGSRQVIAIADCPELRRFLHEQALGVIML